MYCFAVGFWEGGCVEGNKRSGNEFCVVACSYVCVVVSLWCVCVGQGKKLE